MILKSAINAICPYYTMFPLSFPMRVIGRNGVKQGWVVDPFCGRGTTNSAARLHAKPSFGMDSSPIAVAIAQAKLCDTTVERVERTARLILEFGSEPVDVPDGEFWARMYHPDVLPKICKLREALMNDCRSDARRALRAILLGALHGPIAKRTASYLSNQSPRTYAPKPGYAVRFWTKHKLRPPKVDILEMVRIRATRYFTDAPRNTCGLVRCGDSRRATDYPDIPVGLVITSPPYYGMRTYIPDQWLRGWFLGGPPAVDYQHSPRQIQHASPAAFASDLRAVWKTLGEKAVGDARLVVRFGSINDRDIDHVALLKESLKDSGWTLRTIINAGDANTGKRQASQFGLENSVPRLEHDFYAVPA